MKNEYRSCKISIFGDEYALRSDETAEHMAQAASMVDVAMREIAQVSSVGDAKKIAVLSALRIASKLLHLQEEIAINKRQEAELLSRLESDISSLVS